MSNKVFRVTRDSGIQTFPVDASPQTPKQVANLPTLQSVISRLSEGFGSVLVGKAVTNPQIRRLEVQLKPKTRKLGSSGCTSELVKEMINAFFPNFIEVKEHSGVILCQDSQGNNREVLVQESNYQERLDNELNSNRVATRTYSDSLKMSVVGRIEEAPIFVCQLDNPSAEIGIADLQPARHAVLSSLLQELKGSGSGEVSPSAKEKAVEEKVSCVQDNLTATQREAARRQMDRARELKETRERRRKHSKQESWRQP